jgi:starch phosphorylase
MDFKLEGYRPDVILFSMGAYLQRYMPTACGGLEMLEGDTIRSMADQRIKGLAVIQASTNGYFRQRIDDEGWQHEEPIHWSPQNTLPRLDQTVQLDFYDHKLTVGAELYVVRGQTGVRFPVLLLDTDIEPNSPTDRGITGMLYDHNQGTRIAQEYVLGYGGAALLQELGIDARTYQMNEGHPAFLALQLKNRGMSDDDIRSRCALTTHTPLDTAHERWDYGLIKSIMGTTLPDNIRDMAGGDKLEMTRLAGYFSKYMNAVAEKHARVCDAMGVFQYLRNGKPMDHITNGIHPLTWATPHIAQLLDSHTAYKWRLQPEMIGQVASRIPLEEMLEAKADAKMDLIGQLNLYNPVKYDADAFTMVWARRLTDYKRPWLLFRDIDRLHELAEKHGPIQILFAGKAHPNDNKGKQTLRYIWKTCQTLGNKVKADFLENYDPSLARLLLGGSDVWLNTPRRPQEASGTSGMKSSLNLGVNLSVWDGWVPEGYAMDPKGIFIIRPKSDQVTVSADQSREDQEDLASLFEGLDELLGIYYSEEYRKNTAWAEVMAHSLGLVSYFNTDRMVREYSQKIWW